MKRRYEITTNSPACLRCLAVLRNAEEALSGHEIAKLAHIAFNTWQNTIRGVLGDAGLVHVAEWRHNHRGPFVPAYRIGKLVGKAPVKPQKIDQLARSRNWKVRSGYNEIRKAERKMAKVAQAPSVMAALLGIGA